VILLLQRLLALLIVAAVAAQFFLAAAGAFGAINYSAHKTVGYTLAAASLVAALVALLARRHLLPTLLLIVSTRGPSCSRQSRHVELELVWRVPRSECIVGDGGSRQPRAQGGSGA
jgi:hypothetical protein